jgi:hydroxymethylpyrimidine/phosphomethylpyrimidine kinase
MLRAAHAFFDFGVSAVLIKGGHLPWNGSLPSECNDLLLVKANPVPMWLKGERVAKKTHGTGCVFSALITAQLALGAPLAAAVQRAHAALHCALFEAHPMGERQRASPDVFSKDYTNADYDCTQG